MAVKQEFFIFISLSIFIYNIHCINRYWPWGAILFQTCIYKVCGINTSFPPVSHYYIVKMNGILLYKNIDFIMVYALIFIFEYKIALFQIIIGL